MHEGDGGDGDERTEGTEDALPGRRDDGPREPPEPAPLVPWSAQRDAWIAEQAVEKYVWEQQRRAAEAAQVSEDAAVQRARVWSHYVRVEPSLAGPEGGSGVEEPDDEDDATAEPLLLDPPPGWTARPGADPDAARLRAARLPGHAWGTTRWGRAARGSGYARPLLLLGATGTGKSRSAAAQVRRHPGPVLVVSTKSDLVDWTHAHRAERGPVHVLDPAGVTGGRYPAAGFDLMRHARDLDSAGVLVHAMAAWRSGGNEDKDFWMPLGASVNQAVAFACARHGQPVGEWHRIVLEDDGFTANSLLAGAGSDVAESLWQAYTEREERNRSSVLLTARQQVRVLDSPAVQQMLSRDDVDPTRLLPDDQAPADGPTTLYLTVPAGRVEVFGSLVPLVVDLVMDAALEREAVHGPALPPLLVVLDEVAALGLARLPRWADLCRSAGVQLLVLAQSLSTLASAFGPTACDRLLGACDVLSLGGGRDPRTAQLLATATARGSSRRRSGELRRGIELLRSLARMGLGTGLLLTDTNDGQTVRLPLAPA